MGKRKRACRAADFERRASNSRPGLFYYFNKKTRATLWEADFREQFPDAPPVPLPFASALPTAPCAASSGGGLRLCRWAGERGCPLSLLSAGSLSLAFARVSEFQASVVVGAAEAAADCERGGGGGAGEEAAGRRLRAGRPPPLLLPPSPCHPPSPLSLASKALTAACRRPRPLRQSAATGPGSGRCPRAGR